MKKLYRKAAKYTAALSLAVQNRLQYPLELAGPILTYSLFVFIFSRIWQSAFSSGDLIAGYSQRSATWYFIVAELCLMSGGGAFNLLSRDIKDGTIAYALGRPYSFLLYHGAQRFGNGLLTALTLSIPGILLGSLATGFLPLLPISRIPILLISVALSIILQFLLHSMLALTAFWMEENTAFMWIFMKIALVCGTLMPLEFLPESWQAVLLWTPFPWFTWATARLAVLPAETALSELSFTLGGQLLWIGLAGFLLSLVYWRAQNRSIVQGG